MSKRTLILAGLMLLGMSAVIMKLLLAIGCLRGPFALFADWAANYVMRLACYGL